MKITEITRELRWYDLFFVRKIFGLDFERGYGRHVQTVAYSQAELLVSLQNMINQHEYTVRQESGYYGRFLGLIGRRQDPETILTDGTRLIQLHRLIDETPLVKLSASKTYIVDFKDLKAALAAAKARSEALGTSEDPNSGRITG